MTKRPFYLLTLMLFVVSLLMGIAAQTSASRAAKFAAIATAANDEEDRQVFRTLSRIYATEFGPLMTTSLAILACGVAAWIFSRRRRESGLQSVPLVLMIVTFIVQLLLV